MASNDNLRWSDAADEANLMFKVAQEAAKQLGCGALEAFDRLNHIAVEYRGYTWDGEPMTVERVLALANVSVDIRSLRAQADDGVFALDADTSGPVPAPADREVAADGLSVKYRSHVDLVALAADDNQLRRDFDRAQKMGSIDRMSLDEFATGWRDATTDGVDLVATLERDAQIRNLERAAAKAQDLADRLRGA